MTPKLRFKRASSSIRRSRNPKMDALIKVVSTSPAFTVENVLKSVTEALKNRSGEASVSKGPERKA